MLKTQQFTSLIATKTPEDRECLENFVFDESNYELKRHFKTLHKQTFNILTGTVKLHSAQVIGSEIVNNLAYLQNTYCYSCFCKPGKHSIFVYDPVSELMYKKIIALEPSSSFVNRQILMDTAEEMYLK